VSDSAVLAQQVLARVAEFVGTLGHDELADLATGRARLQIAPPAARAVPGRDAIGAFLATAADRASARQYLDGLHLSVAQLRELAAQLGIAVASKATRGQLRDTVVHWTVGRRVDAAVLSRPKPR
jgi:hypothetical protein